ncbi:MAG: RNA methyltransferase PUA domain-containing protein [Ilumatobacteraceae bacterium]
MGWPPEELHSSAAHAIVADVGVPVLDDDDRHHLLKVLRLRDGERITVTDGAGSWASAVVRSGGHLERIGGIGERAPLFPRHIAFAIAKGDRAELDRAEAHRDRRRSDHADGDRAHRGPPRRANGQA